MLLLVVLFTIYSRSGLCTLISNIVPSISSVYSERINVSLSNKIMLIGLYASHCNILLKRTENLRFFGHKRGFFLDFSFGLVVLKV